MALWAPASPPTVLAPVPPSFRGRSAELSRRRAAAVLSNHTAFFPFQIAAGVLIRGSSTRRCRAPGAGGQDAPSECFEVCPLEGKGLGVLARREIQAGELIVSEKPLLLLPYAHLGSQTDADVERLLGELPNEQQEHFWALFDAQLFDAERSAKSRVLTNSYPVEDDSGNTSAAVFNVIARFNHSCVPNVHNSWNAGSGLESLFAVRRIEQGEELCTSYLDLYKVRADRQQELSRKLKFQCTCEACTLTGKDRDASDASRQRLWRLSQELEASPEEKLADMVEEVADLVELELRGNPALKCRAFTAGFEAAAQLGDLPLAEDMAQRALDQVLLVEGPSPRAQMLQQCVELFGG